MVGFEPTVHCTKNSCLTTWLHPNGEALFTLQRRLVQGGKRKKIRLIDLNFLSTLCFGMGDRAFGMNFDRPTCTNQKAKAKCLGFHGY